MLASPHTQLLDTPFDFLEETPPLLDPWWDLYLPALHGDRVQVLAALATIDRDVPASRRSDFLAVGARALFVLGGHAEAGRLAERAIAMGGEEAVSLATFTHPLGERFAEERVWTGRSAGARADAACDLAFLRLRRGNVAAAETALNLAASACPDHAEAARWRRFLGECREPASVIRRQTGMDARKALPVTRDGLDLSCCRDLGWVSAERLRRRVVTPVLRPAPAGSGLQRLSEAARTGFWLHSEADLRRFNQRSSAVEVEILADTVVSLVHEGRPADFPARTLWAIATAPGQPAAMASNRAASDREASDCATFLLTLATAGGSLEAFARELSTSLVERFPEDGAWRVWRAYFSEASGENRALAIAELASPGNDVLRWRLSVEMLRREGELSALKRLLSALRDHPLVGAIAKDVLLDPSVPLPPTPPAPRVGRR